MLSLASKLGMPLLKLISEKKKNQAIILCDYILNIKMYQRCHTTLVVCVIIIYSWLIP